MKQTLLQSFKNAFSGLFYCIKKERNMKIHISIMLCVIIAGIILQINTHEWYICLILSGLILSLELINTAIEAVVDLCTDKYHELAKVAKDTAAGAVLISAIMSAIIGISIFLPKIYALLIK